MPVPPRLRVFHLFYKRIFPHSACTCLPTPRFCRAFPAAHYSVYPVHYPTPASQLLVSPLRSPCTIRFASSPGFFVFFFTSSPPHLTPFSADCSVRCPIRVHPPLSPRYPPCCSAHFLVLFYLLLLPFPPSNQSFWGPLFIFFFFVLRILFLHLLTYVIFPLHGFAHPIIPYSAPSFSILFLWPPYFFFAFLSFFSDMPSPFCLYL